MNLLRLASLPVLVFALATSGIAAAKGAKPAKKDAAAAKVAKAKDVKKKKGTPNASDPAPADYPYGPAGSDQRARTL